MDPNDLKVFKQEFKPETSKCGRQRGLSEETNLLSSEILEKM